MTTTTRTEYHGDEECPNVKLGNPTDARYYVDTAVDEDGYPIRAKNVVACCYLAAEWQRGEDHEAGAGR